ncbi:MAG: DUF1624 domain-containing protein [Bacilli bacterium]|nr:DUF1624 domain-containing protein [Bacilli bacterium]
MVLDNQKVSRKAGAFEKRVHEIDFMRGVLILIVVMDHILNNIMLHAANWADWVPQNPAFQDLFDGMVWYWDGEPRAVIRYLALFLFCFVSGISSQFSRNNWKRAGELLVVWAFLLVGGRLLEAYNWLPGTNTRIDFNIIGVLAFSTLFYCFIQNQSWKGMLASCLIWFLVSCYLVPFLGAINTSTKEGVYLPASENMNIYLPVLWNGKRYFTADWMPLFPYITFFFMGAVFSYFFYREKKSYFKRHEWERPFCFVGRNTIWIYLGHQVVFIPFFMLIDVIIKACYGI